MSHISKRILSAIAMVLATLAIPVSLYAAQSPGAFADVGIGARPVGMGGAYVAVAGDLSSLLWNPAGLADVRERQVLFTHMKQFNLVPYTCGVFGKPVGERQTAVAGVLTAGDAVMREHTVLLAYSRALERHPHWIRNVLGGAAIKLRVSTFGGDADGGENRVTGHAFGVAFDVGARANLAKMLSLGVVVKDLVAPVQWSTSVKGGYIESVPRTVQTGLALGAADRMIFAVDLENRELLKVGIETVLLDVVALRGGYRWPLTTEWERSYTTGFGLSQLFKNGLALGADLSLSFEDLATTSRFSLTVGF
jgi:hypothetical protein